MGDKGIISKSLLKSLLRDFAVYLFGLPVAEVELVETAIITVVGRQPFAANSPAGEKSA